MVSVTETDIVIINVVIQEFLVTKRPVLRRPLIVRAKSPEVLDKLVRWSILATDDQRAYLPKALAFHYCGNAPTLLLAKQSLEMLARVLVQIFPESPEDKFFSFEEIKSEIEKRFGAVDPQEIKLAMYLAPDFNLLAGWKGERAEMEALRISEYVLQIEKPGELWDNHINRQTEWISTQVEGSVPAYVQDDSSSPEEDINIAVTQESIKDQIKKYGGWQIVKPLGNQTGQAEVFLVRSPQRVAELSAASRAIQAYGRTKSADDPAIFATAIWQSARADLTAELGALKIFKMRGDGPEAVQEVLDRLKGEIEILKQHRPGLLPMLAASDEDRWIITEYQSGGTLQDYPHRFKGKAALALRAFRPLVQAVQGLHSERIVHRDIKPANVFVANESDLILGDFGIVYLPYQAERVTRTNERVGPFDYMPSWADLGERLEQVEPNFDVYMLGKLLWCMVSGRLKLPREYFRKKEFDLTLLFPDDPHMHVVNSILDRCVVEGPKDCFDSAAELLSTVDVFLRMIDRGGRLMGERIPRPCRVCGMGHYQSSGIPSTLRTLPKEGPVGLGIWINGKDPATIPVYPFACDSCGHVEFFTRPAPRPN
jgi:serine/threonine protein kinase